MAGVGYATTNHPILVSEGQTDPVAARERGFASPTALMRHAVEQELARGDRAEAHIAAFVDALAKTVCRFWPGISRTLHSLINCCGDSVSHNQVVNLRSLMDVIESHLNLTATWRGLQANSTA